MFNLSRKEALKLAELADKYDFIRKQITPAGLAWLEYIKQPWYIRLWLWLKPRRSQPRVFGAFMDEMRQQQPNYFSDQK